MLLLCEIVISHRSVDVDGSLRGCNAGWTCSRYQISEEHIVSPEDGGVSYKKLFLSQKKLPIL